MQSVCGSHRNYVKSSLLFCEGEWSPLELPYWTIIYNSRTPSQMAKETSRTTPVPNWIGNLFSTSQSHAHIIPLPYHQSEHFVQSISSIFHVSSLVWALSNITTPALPAETLFEVHEWCLCNLQASITSSCFGSSRPLGNYFVWYSNMLMLSLKLYKRRFRPKSRTIRVATKLYHQYTVGTSQVPPVVLPAHR